MKKKALGLVLVIGILVFLPLISVAAEKGSGKYITFIDDPDQEKLPISVVKAMLKFQLPEIKNEWNHPYYPITYSREQYVDVNGDGFVDLVKRIKLEAVYFNGKMTGHFYVTISWHTLTKYRDRDGLFQNTKATAEQSYYFHYGKHSIPKNRRSRYSWIKGKEDFVTADELKQYLLTQRIIEK